MSADRTALLAASYRRCRAITRAHGTTYFWATRLLPRSSQHHVHAVYAFCRTADDVVDDMGTGASLEQRRAALAELGEQLGAGLAAGWSDDPVLAAVVHTVDHAGIDPTCFDRFLASMAMDLTTDRYETWADLGRYTDGSAAVIGEMMLPILQPSSPEAIAHARDLGVAFQLTNFLRDVGEDLDRGRVYLPLEDLRRFDADPWARVVTPEWQALMAFEIARARALYASADRGIAMLPPRSARCVGSARVLYSRILERIEANRYDVFSTRARVPTAEKLLTVVGWRAPRRSTSAPVAARKSSVARPARPTGTRKPYGAPPPA